MTDPRSYRPPPINNSGTRRRVGVVAEMAPNQFVKIVLEVDDSRFDHEAIFGMESGTQAVTFADYSQPLRYVASRETTATIRLVGRVVSQEEADRPAWATTSPEIEARREIEP
jgi:hypothetical protein